MRKWYLPWNTANPSKYTACWYFLFSIHLISSKLREFQERSAARSKLKMWQNCIGCYNPLCCSVMFWNQSKTSHLVVNRWLKLKAKVLPWIQQSVYTLSRQKFPTRGMKSSGFLSPTWNKNQSINQSIIERSKMKPLFIYPVFIFNRLIKMIISNQ